MNEVSKRRALPAKGWGGAIGLAIGLLCSPTLPTARVAGAPLSFSLERSEDSSGDQQVVFFTFRCGSKRYTFCPPTNWKSTGDDTGRSFSLPTPEGDAVAQFRTGSPAELVLLNPDQKEHREPAFRRNLPAGFSELKQVGGENTDPVPVLSRRSSEITYRYNFFGLAFGASVMVCQLDEHNGFVLIILAPAGICDEFIGQVYRMLGAIRIEEEPPVSDARP